METTISVSSETRDRLKQLLSKAETYDEGIQRLIFTVADAKLQEQQKK